MLLRGDRLLLWPGYRLLWLRDRLLGLKYRLLEGDRLLGGDRRLLISHVLVYIGACIMCKPENLN